MSYILEALKKSQQERELGHVPRLEAVRFEDPPEQLDRYRWVYAGLLPALLAIGIALFALLRPVQAPDGAAGITAKADVGVEPSPLPNNKPGREQAAPDGVAAARETGRSAPVRPPAEPTIETPDYSEPDLPAEVDAWIAAAEDSGRPSIRPTSATRGSPKSALDDAGRITVEPEVMVVPAPPTSGRPLPRGAEELRRAALGSQDAPSGSPPTSVPATTRPPSEYTPVPTDLIADIEAFKREVAAVAPAPPVIPPAPRPAKAPTLKKSPEQPEPTLPPTPSVALRDKLPQFRMSVHIYDDDPERRFVYINGRKLREQEQSREGIRVERVVADGAVLSFQGESFFQTR